MAEISLLHYLDQESKEAVLEISSSSVSLRVFSCPYDGECIPAELFLYALFADDIQAVSEFELPKKTNNGYFSYHIIGTVVDTTKQIVQVEDICIILDMPIPRDIPNGSLVSFSVQRLDYYTM